MSPGATLPPEVGSLVGTELVFLNGTTHIGGTQVVLTSPRSEIYFDLGRGQTEKAALFNDLVPPGMTHSVLVDYLGAAMAPLSEGLYDAEELSGTVAALLAELRRPGRLLDGAPLFLETERERAIFTSHLHSDHSRLLPFLNRRQRVFMSSTSRHLQACMETAGLVAPARAQLLPCETGDTVSIGDITIHFMRVDHDTPGAMGFIAQTQDGTVAYTGDWRYHGLHPEHMDAFSNRCRELGVDILITEATTAQPPELPRWPWGGGLPQGLIGRGVSPDAPLPEKEAGDEIASLIEADRGLVFVCFDRQNLERAESLLLAAKRAGRRLVVEPRTAVYWLEASRRGVATIDRSVLACFETAEEADPASAEILRVSFATVAKNRDAFVCQLSPSTYGTMLALGLYSEDLVIHANGDPLGSQYPGWESLENWVRTLGCRFAVVDSHGHADPVALQRLIHDIRPRRVVPMHSDHREHSAVPDELRYLPQRWQRMPVAF
jgi:mRNA degradation ribonuclease J1/J2